MTESPPKHRLWLALILAASIVTFLPSLWNGYVLDDALVAEPIGPDGTVRPMVNELQSISDYFDSHYWRDIYTSSNLYRPVTKLSIALVHAVARRAAAVAQHLVNVLVHAACVWLVYRMVLALGLPSKCALVAALVFAIHAIHSEAVISIVGRAELLGFAFGAAAITLLARSWSSARRWPWLIGSGAALFLAFCSKENALPWAVFLPLFVAVRNRVAASRPVSVRQAALVPVVPLALFFALRAHALAPLPEPPPVYFQANPLAASDTLARVCSATMIWAYGLVKCVFPFRLAADYGPQVFDLATGPADLRFIGSALLLLGVLVGGLLAYRRRPVLFLASAAFLGFGFLTSNIPFAIGTIFAERLFYTPVLATCLLVAWWNSVAKTHEARVVITLVLVLWTGHSSSMAFRRNFDWRSNDTLALHDVRVHPRSVHLQTRASDAEWNRGNRDAAVARLEQATKLDPSFALAWANLSALQLLVGRPDAAETTARSGLEHAPEHMTGERAMLHTNLGLALRAKKQVGDAIAEFRAAVELEPRSVARRTRLLGAALGNVSNGQFEAMLDDARRSLPGHPAWGYYQARLDRLQNRNEAAKAVLERVVHGAPGYLDAVLLLAETVLDLGDKRRAQELAERVLAAPDRGLHARARAVMQRARR